MRVLPESPPTRQLSIDQQPRTPSRWTTIRCPETSADCVTVRLPTYLDSVAVGTGLKRRASASNTPIIGLFLKRVLDVLHSIGGRRRHRLLRLWEFTF
jgi:hypothetical protein